MRSKGGWIVVALALGLGALVPWVLRSGGGAARDGAPASAAARRADEPAPATQGLVAVARPDEGRAGRIGAQVAKPAALEAEGEGLTLLVDVWDASGAPFAGRELDWALGGVKLGPDGLAETCGGEGTSDGAGRLTIALPKRALAWSQRWLFVRWEGELGGLVALSDGPADGEVRLGPLHLVALPRVAAGRVVDGAGAPLVGAWVDVRVEGVDASDPRLLQPVVTEAGGRFDVRGWVQAPQPVRVMARRRGAHSSEVQAPFGSAELELTLRRDGSLAGRVLHGVSSPPSNLRLLARPRAEGVSPVEARPGRDGSFLLGNLPPGTYDVAAVADGVSEPLALVEDVVVRDAERSQPPELDPLDLRGLLREVVVRIKAHDRRALMATLYFRASGAPEEEPWSQVDAPGLVRLVTTAPALDLRASSPGYRSAARGDVVTGATLSLEAGYALLLRLRAPDALPASCELRVRLVPAPPLQPETIPAAGLRFELEPRTASLQELRFERDGACRATVSEAGSYTAVLLLRCPLAPDFSEVKLCDLADAWEQTIRSPSPPVELERPFEVLDAPGEQTVWLDLDPEAIQRALERR